MGRIVAFSKWDELTLGTNCRFLEFGTNCRLGRIVAWDELSLGTNCRLGRIVAWDELSLGTNCRLGRIVAWDELSLGTNCRLGRIVAWDELSLGTNCRLGRIVAFWNLGRIVAWDELSPNRINGCFLVMQNLKKIRNLYQKFVLHRSSARFFCSDFTTNMKAKGWDVRIVFYFSL